MPTLIDPHEVDDGSDNDEKPEDGREFDDDDELFGDIGAGEDFVTLARVADGESNEQADVGNPVDIGVVEGGQHVDFVQRGAELSFLTAYEYVMCVDPSVKDKCQDECTRNWKDPKSHHRI